MKILLINPIITKQFFKQLITISEPLGLCYIAAMVEDKHEVEILDGSIKGLTYEEITDTLKNFQPDIVGISLPYSLLIKSAKEIAAFIRTHFPDIKIILGGNVATFIADDLIQNDGIDIIVLGEGEITFRELVGVLEKKDESLLKNVNGICYKAKNNEVIRNPSRQIIEDLDSLPIPSRVHLKQKAYYRRTVITSRGCPYGCIYCSNSHFFQKYRLRSVDHIMKEIKSIFAPDLGYMDETITFVDDVLTLDNKRLEQLCDGLSGMGKNINWQCYGRLENMNEDILTKMRNAGCSLIFFGVESGSPKILNTLKRKYSPEDVVRITNICKNLGISTQCAFIIGLPYETKEDLDLTFKLIEQIPDSYVFSIFTALPGTPVYKDPAKYGLTIQPHLPEDDNFNQCSWVFNGHISSEEVLAAYYKAIGLALQKGKKMGKIR